MKLKIILGTFIFVLTFSLIYISLNNIFANKDSDLTFEKQFNQSLTSKTYAKKFYDNLPKGDVTSLDCSEAVEKYSEKDRLFFKSFYGYNKKRCLGFNDYTNTDGGLRIEEVVVDLVTGQELLSCSYTTFDGNENITCKDVDETWVWKKGDPLPYPEPYPVYMSVWKSLPQLD